MSAALPRYEQRARPFRSVGFMRGEGHQIDPEGGKIDVALADTLRGIDMYPCVSRSSATLGDRADVLDHSGLVIHVHDGHQHGIGAYGGRHARRIESSVGIRREIGDAPAAPLELLARIEHRLVLRASGDDVCSQVPVVLCRSENREVVGLGGAGGEHDVVGSAPTAAATCARAPSTDALAASP